MRRSYVLSALGALVLAACSPSDEPTCGEVALHAAMLVAADGKPAEKMSKSDAYRIGKGKEFREECRYGYGESERRCAMKATTKTALLECLGRMPEDRSTTYDSYGAYKAPDIQLLCGDGEQVNTESDGRWTLSCKKNGLAHGPYMETKRDGKTLVSGAYADDLKDGAWATFDWEGLPVETGTYRAGKKHGTWVRYHEGTRSVASEWPYEDDVVHGTAVAYHYNGNRSSQTTYVRGVAEGAHLEWDSEGNKSSEGTYAGGELDGPYVSYSLGKKVHEAHYRDGDLHGAEIEWSPSGKKLSQATWVDGVKHGKVTHWNLDGSVLFVETYVDGEAIVWAEIERFEDGRVSYITAMKHETAHGIHRAYWEDGKLSESGQHKFDSKDGTWTEWGEDGKKVLEQSWSGGRLHGRGTEWYEGTSQKLSEGPWHHGRRHGVWTTWYANGRIATKGAYEADLREGVWVEYHENGKKALEGTYRADVAVGTLREWDESGKPVSADGADGDEE